MDRSNPSVPRSIGVVAAVIGGVATWLLVENALGVSFLMGPGMPMSTPVIAIGSLVVGVLGWLAAEMFVGPFPNQR